MTAIVNILALIIKLGPIAKILGLLAPLSGALGFLSPIMAGISAILAPIFEGIGKGIVWFFKTLGAGIRECFAHPAVFVVVFTAALAAGAYTGHWKGKEAKAVKKELATCKTQVKTVVKKQQCPPTFKWPF